MIDLIATDTMFPEYRYGMDTDEYLRENNNYLFLLREDLNYALHNLGIANFNARQLETLSGRISEPLYSRIADAEGHIASLSYDYGLIEARVSDNEQSISDIRIDAQGIHTQVLEIQGDISDITGDMSGLTTRVSSVEQTASGISATVQEIQGDVSDLSGGLTAVTARVAQVEITAGNISSTVQELSTTVSTLSGSVTSLSSRVSSVEQTATSITSTVQEIQQDVSSLEGDVSDLSGDVSTLSGSVTSLSSRVSSVEQTATSITSTVQEIQGDYISATSAKQTSSAFSLTVKNGSGSTAAVLDKNGLSVYGGALSLYSAGTASSNRVLYADNSGNLYIKGNITVKSLTLDSGATIDSTFVNNMKSSLTNAGMAQTSQIPTNLNQLTNGPGYQTSAQVGSLIANTVTAAYVNALGITVNAANITGTLTASKISLSGYEGTIGTSTTKISMSDTSGIYMSCLRPVTLESSSYEVKITSGTYSVELATWGAFIPLRDNAIGLGNGNYRWSTVYAGTGQINTSDRNQKLDINYDISKYDSIFDRVDPASFLMVDGTSGRTHTGFISQDFEEALEEEGLTALDFAAFCKDEFEDGSVVYGLRYSELTALLWRQVKLLKARVEALEE